MRETNVRVPECALQRLAELSNKLRLSRDATVRHLIGVFIERQDALDPDDRLTHISTVMRHPLPPVAKTHSPVGKQLRLRLPDGVAQRARGVGFRAPGQAWSRGHHDYQSRLLTDAVMTAIALGCQEYGLEPIADEVLAGVHPLLRHRAARGLWWLAVSVTQSGAETDAFLQAAEDQKAREQAMARSGSLAPPTHWERVAASLRGMKAGNSDTEEGAVWHHRHRNHIVQRLAYAFLRGDKVSRDQMEQRLYDQDGDAQWGEDKEWDTLILDAMEVIAHSRKASEADDHDADEAEVRAVERSDESDERYPISRRHDLARQSPGLELDRTDPQAPVLVSGPGNIEGRGGGAVWRAERILAVDEIPRWLVESASKTGTEVRNHVVPHPGWRLDMPEAWQPLFLPGERPVPHGWEAHLAARRVLHFEGGGSTILWPTMWDDRREEGIPVPGIDAVVEAIGARKSASEIAEILLMELIPRTADEAEEWNNRTSIPEAEDTTASGVDPFEPSIGGGALPVAEEGDDEQVVRFPGDVPPLSTIKFHRTGDYSVDDDPGPGLDSSRRMLEGDDLMQTVLVPAEIAEEFGFIDTARRDQLISEAREETGRRMRSALGRLPSRHQDRRRELETAMDDPARFSTLARTVEVKFHEYRALWCWPVTSLADEVLFGRPPQVLAWLADYLRQSHTRELERAMEEAYREAMHRFAYRYE